MKISQVYKRYWLAILAAILVTSSVNRLAFKLMEQYSVDELIQVLIIVPFHILQLLLYAFIISVYHRRRHSN